MKTKMKILAGLALALVAGCSDGVLPPLSDNANPGESVVKTTIAEFSANPLTVDRGASTTLSWDVANAGRIEIVSSSTTAKFSYQSDKDFKSSTTVDNLQETTTFILTAYPKEAEPSAAEEGEEAAAAGQAVAKVAPTTPETPEAPGAEEQKPEENAGETEALSGPQPVQQSVTVTVRAGAQGLNIERFYADAEQVSESENSYNAEALDTIVLQWSVVPAEAKVNITASTGEQPVVVDCTASTSKAMEETGEVTGNYPAAGCATVSPSDDTVYTLEATLGDETVTQELAVSVSGEPSANLTVNGTGDLSVTSYPQQVQLAWRVSPKNAKVTIVAEPQLAGAQLPQEADGYEGMITVTVERDTNFTLTTTVNGEAFASARASVRSQLSGIDCSQFNAYAMTQSPLFAGEAVKIAWSAPQSSAFNGVRVTDSAGEKAEAALETGYVEMPAKSGGYTVAFLSQEKDYCPKMVNVPVARISAVSEDKMVRVVGNAADPSLALAGADLGKFSETIRVVQVGELVKNNDIPYFKALTSFDNVTKLLNKRFMEKVIQTFPLNAVISTEKRLLVATTGAILYQDEDEKGEKVWKTLTPLLRTDDFGDYSGSHDSCFGKKQTGKEGSFKGEIVTMTQVCDMVVTSGGKLFVAADNGLFFIDSLEGYIADSGSTPWKDSDLYGSVVNDVEVASIDGKEVIFAGGSKGVYRSDDGGATWVSLNGGALGSAGTGEAKTVYSVAVLPSAEGVVILAGTDDGVMVHEGSTWVARPLPVSTDEMQLKENAGRVYSVETDSRGTIYAAAESGLYVSRDRGASFANVTPAAGNRQPVVRSVYANYSGDPIKSTADYTLYLATESGVMRAAVEGFKINTAASANGSAGQ